MLAGVIWVIRLTENKSSPTDKRNIFIHKQSNINRLAKILLYIWD